MNNSKSDFDLSKYQITSGIIHPYFELLDKDNKWHLYEGAIGLNRFQYYKVAKQSKAGELCTQNHNNSRTKKGNRNSDSIWDDITALISACNDEALEKLSGADAYLKYWNDCYDEKDKKELSVFHGIQHFEALKDWYNIQLQAYLKTKEGQYLSEEIKQSDIKRWATGMLESIEDYLEVSETLKGNGFSGISSYHATELCKFHYWIANRLNEQITINTTQKTQQERRQMGLDKILKVWAVKGYDGYKSSHTLGVIGERFSADFKEWIGDDENYTKLNEGSKLSEWETFFDFKKSLRTDFQNRLSIVPDKKIFVANWIAEAEETFCVGQNGIQLKNIHRKAIYAPFWDVTFGLDHPVKYYAYLIYDLEENNSPDIGNFIYLMALGFAFAHLLAEIKQSDGQIINDTNEPTALKISSIKNNFDAIPIIQVYNHFKKGLVDGKFLNEVELLQFISLAFDKKEIPTPLFKLNCGNRTNKVKKVFYDYFFSVACKPYGKANAYAALMGDYFEGQKTRNIVTNWSK